MTREQQIDYLVLATLILATPKPSEFVPTALRAAERFAVNRSALYEQVQHAWKYHHMFASVGHRPWPIIWNGRVYHFN